MFYVRRISSWIPSSPREKKVVGIELCSVSKVSFPSLYVCAVSIPIHHYPTLGSRSLVVSSSVVVVVDKVTMLQGDYVSSIRA